MANNQAIQILRGSTDYDPSNIINDGLLDGQPFYSKKNKQLYIGDNSENDIVPVGAANLKPGIGKGSIEQINLDLNDYNPEAIGVNSIALGSGQDNSEFLNEKEFSYLKAEGSVFQQDENYPDNTQVTGNQSLSQGTSNYIKGNNSAAIGKNNIVLKDESFAFGDKNVNLTGNSFICGYQNHFKDNNSDYQFAANKCNIIESGEAATAFGSNNIVFKGTGSFIGGINNRIGQYDENNEISESRSNVVFGEDNISSGASNFTIGNNNINYGDYSIVAGQNNIIEATHENSFVFGTNWKTSYCNQVAFGFGGKNEESTTLENDVRFTVGVQGDDLKSKQAFTIKTNEINLDLPTTLSQSPIKEIDVLRLQELIIDKEFFDSLY